MRSFHETLGALADRVSYLESACKVLQSYGIEAHVHYRPHGHVRLEVDVDGTQHDLEFTLTDALKHENAKAAEQLFKAACIAANVTFT